MRLPRQLFLTATLLLGGCGGGVDFEVGDKDKNKEKDPETDIELPPRPLIVRGAEAGPDINHVLHAEASSLSVPYVYEPSVDQSLTLHVVRIHAKHCGGMKEPVPAFTWIKEPPAGDPTTPPEELKVVPTEPFAAAQGRRYALRVEIETEWGLCETLGVSFDVRTR
jgi:hypothetical protein